MDKEFGFIDLCDLDKKESADHIVGVVGEETVLIPTDKLSGEKDWNVNDSNDPAYIKNRPVHISNKTLVDKVYIGGSLSGDREQGYVYFALPNDAKDSIDSTIGKRYTITFYKKDNVNISYTFNGISENAIDSDGNHEIRVRYTDNENVYVNGYGVRVPMYIYDEFGNYNILMSMAKCGANVQDEYLPLFQPDCNETDETKPGYIKNMPIKKENIYNMHMDGVEFYFLHYMTGCAVMQPTTGVRANTMWAEVGKTYTLTLDNGETVKEVVLTTKTSQWGGVELSSNDCCEMLFIDNDLSYTLWVDEKFWLSSVGVVKVTVKGNSVGSMLVKSDGTPLDKSYAIDSEKYRYGDELLKAIAGNRIPLVKIPNEDNNDLYDNYVLPWQMQVPKNGNDYVNVFYTKDKFAQNLVALLIEILTTGDFTNLEEKFGTLFGEMELQLHNPCEEAPIECEEPLD